MDPAGRTILVTGGATGIGFALATRCLAAGSTVIVCGRRADKLEEAQRQHPALHVRVADLEHDSSRAALVDWAVGAFPRLDVLVNNAGIQRRMQLTHERDWHRTRQEIAINFEAAVHLSLLLLPHLERQEHPAIVNITSGLAFAPLVAVPVYSATKAALHSFTLSLRQQLTGTRVEVVEIIPPAVNTDLGGPGLHTFGVPLEEFADAAFARLVKGEREIAYGFAEKSSRASRAELDEMFSRMNQGGR